MIGNRWPADLMQFGPFSQDEDGKVRQ